MDDYTTVEVVYPKPGERLSPDEERFVLVFSGDIVSETTSPIDLIDEHYIRVAKKMGLSKLYVITYSDPDKA